MFVKFRIIAGMATYNSTQYADWRNGSLILCCLLLALGCASPSGTADIRNGSALIGKTEAAVLACAGQPNQDVRTGKLHILKYYRESSLLEESRVSSKGSNPAIHRGCWASLLMEDDRVAGIEFRPVPDTETDPYNCKKVFEACGQ